MPLVLFYEFNIYLDLPIYFSVCLFFILSCITDPFGILFLLLMINRNFLCWSLFIVIRLSFVFVLKVLVWPFFLKYTLNFQLFSAGHWALNLISYVFISSENSVVIAIVTSLKLIYPFTLVVFKIFVFVFGIWSFTLMRPGVSLFFTLTWNQWYLCPRALVKEPVAETHTK